MQATIHGITAEHLMHAQCDSLLDALADLCSTALFRTIVPKKVQFSPIVPVLKKKTLDQKSVSNFRSITISSVFTKIFDFLIWPEVDDGIADTQFGFRAGRDTSAAYCALNDLMIFAIDQGTPLYMCSLDAASGM
jgi:hypothetical protein